ncbi:MAG: chemotaxis protein CheY [Devosia sp.]|nr:chemotaxis protein CheY [Devosia sp.]
MVEVRSTALGGRRILVAEDEFMIAGEIANELEARNAQVIGPVPTVAQALRAIEASCALDGAILDMNLHDEMVFPVAEALRARGVPFVLSTGYDRSLIPPHLADAPRCEKPVDPVALVDMLARYLAG